MREASACRVAYVIGELGRGGAEYQLYELLRVLDRTRYRPHVFALATGGWWAGPIRALGVEVTELPSTRRLEWRRLRALRAGLRVVAPHVLHTILWSGNAYGRLAAVGLGIPAVVTAERNVIRRPGWQRAFERLLDRVTDRYLVNSAAVVTELVEHGGLPRAKMEVIHNGIDLGRVPAFDLDRQRARRAVGLDPDRRLVAQVGRLEAQKDVPTYLGAAARIAARVPDVDFLVVGEGALRDGLEALAGRLGLAARVRFTGGRDDVPALLAGVDVLVLASRYEGLPNVVIEAMATGAVVVCTDVGGARELVVPEETGFLVPTEHPDAIADAVLGVLAAPARADALARAARRRVEERFTVEAMARRTVAAYEELLHAARAAVPAPRPA